MICPFVPGDIVQVKTLEQLRSQYPELSSGGFLMPTCGFNAGMYKLCGMKFRIKTVCREVGSELVYLRSEEGIENEESRPYGFWCITPYMVDLVAFTEKECDQDIDMNTWLSMLS